MSKIIKHKEATIKIDLINTNLRRIQVKLKDPSTFSPRTQFVTHYPLYLIKKVLEIKNPAYLCDEIARDEDPHYVESDIHASIFSYISKSELEGKQLLDLGCGSGASTMIMARAVPNCQIYGVDLDEKLLSLAQLRAKYYNYKNLKFFCSPSPDDLPRIIEKVDFVLLSAVYEHLLPLERKILLGKIWSRLTTNGMLFINQTPDRRFPIEIHTSRLPLINYVPDRFAYFLACRFSKIDLDGSWESLLRKGIRGATPHDILIILNRFPSPAILLNPNAKGIRKQSDIWYYSAKARLSNRYSSRLVNKTIQVLIDFIVLIRFPIAPYLSLAIRKGKPDK